MPSMRNVVCGLALCGVATLAFGADKPASATKRFALPGGQTMVIQWNSSWAEIALPPGVPDGTVAFSGPDASRMRVMLVPMPPDPNFTGDPGNLRILARGLTRELQESGGEVDEEQRMIEGQNVRGLYVKGIDPKPKPGEFTFIYAGPLSINSRLYIFEILWNTGGETSANAALAALRTVRIQ